MLAGGSTGEVAQATGLALERRSGVRALHLLRNAPIVLLVKEKDNPWIEIVPGIRRRTIVAGATMYQMRAELAAGSRLPEHAHPQEQITHVIAGRMRMFVDGVAHELAAGDSLYLAANVPHRAETIEKTSVIDTFSPPRTDYLARDADARRSG